MYLDKVRETIKKYDMISRGDKIVVGFSGGPDSTCLLHSLAILKEELGISKIYAVHINHCLRGKEADRDELYCAKLARKLGIDFFSFHSDIAAEAARNGISTETEGRRARYAAFRRVCEITGAKKIAVAHNRNDQAETVLMRIMRGTGVHGLIGIEYVRVDDADSKYDGFSEIFLSNDKFVSDFERAYGCRISIIESKIGESELSCFEASDGERSKIGETKGELSGFDEPDAGQSKVGETGGAKVVDAGRIEVGEAEDEADGERIETGEKSGGRGYCERKIIRPILDMTRKEIEDYCAENGLEPVIDSTNSETIYTRNKIRLGLLPEMRDTFNPSVDDAIVRLSRSAAMDDDFISSEASKLMKGRFRKSDMSLDISGLAGKHSAVLSRIAAKAAKEAGMSENLGEAQINALVDAMHEAADQNTKKTKEIDLLQGNYVYAAYGKMWFLNRNISCDETAAKLTETQISDIESGEAAQLALGRKKITIKMLSDVQREALFEKSGASRRSERLEDSENTGGLKYSEKLKKSGNAGSLDGSESSENSENLRNSGNLEDSGNSEGLGSLRNSEGARSSENSEEARNSKSLRNSESLRDSESLGVSKNSESTENPRISGSARSSENSEGTRSSGSLENPGNSESLEGAGSSESLEGAGSSESLRNTEGLGDSKNPVSRGFYENKYKNKNDGGGYRLFVDWDALCGLKEDPVFRFRRAGDRIQPKGMKGHKKLQDFFTDRKIPKHLRDSVILLASGSEIIIAGREISDLCIIRKGKTKRIISIDFD